MLEDLLRDIQKAKVRLERVDERNAETSKKISEFLAEIEELASYLRTGQPRTRTQQQKMKVFTSCEDAMKAIANLEHERSHLLESFGSLLRQTEIESQS